MARVRGLTTAFGLLEPEIRSATPCATVGLVLPGAGGTLRFEVRNRQTVSAIFVAADSVPPELRLPIDRPRQRAPIGPAAPGRAIERFLTAFGLDAVCAVPVPVDGGGLLFGAMADPQPLADDHVVALGRFARRLATVAAEPEPLEQWERRGARFDELAEMLPVLATALDVRAIFDHLSTIARRVLPHDFAVIGLYAEGGRKVRLHALSFPPDVTIPEIIDNPYPEAFDEGWDYAVHRDLLSHPIEADRAATRIGMRSAVRTAIRVDGRVAGVLSLSSSQPDAYGDADVPIAQRIAELITLVLSHQHFADDARRAAAVQARAANLEMLEQLLETLSGVLDIREVFGRVSSIAHRVLKHDAMAIAMTLDNPPRLRVHALSGFDHVADSFEAPMPEPELMSSAWDYRLMNFGDDPRYAASPTVKAGMQSVLCVPVRLEGRLYAAVNFYSRAKGAFSEDDILVARRITDHITLACSHQRLVEEAQRNVELRADAESLEMLDALLAAETHAGELDEVFDRVSTIAQRVLPHDILLLPVATADGRHARIHARGGAHAASFPEVVEIPETILAQPGWQYELIDDLQQHPVQRFTNAARLGLRSALRVPVRLEDRYAGALVFFSYQPARYKQSDVMVARRIADRVTLILARDRGAEAARRAEAATARAAKLEARVRQLTDELDVRTGIRRVVGESPTWRQVLLQATRVAATETTVLLLGESGTGKEVVARFLHRASERNKGPFVALNCAALPEHLLEAELFGYERGAFTGAAQSKPGQLEQAAGGTMFLDEVGEMSLPAQAKFLRVLQEREFQRLGGTRVLRADARIIAATNRDLKKAIAHNAFREDLFYRLNVFAIRLPPLRERRDDILTLTDTFLAEISRGLGRPPSGITREARAKLLDYHWPGNVRELRNILERAAILCDGGAITPDHLAVNRSAAPAIPAPAPAILSSPVSGPRAAAPADPIPSSPPASTAADLQSMERTLIEQALQSARFNKSKAAKSLGLTRAQLYVRMRRYGLE